MSEGDASARGRRRLFSRDAVRPRDLAIAAAIAAIGALGALPGARGGVDPLACAAWIAIAAPSCGWLARALGLPAWPLAVAIPASWAIVLGLVDGAAARHLRDPVWAAVAWSALYAAGFAVSRGDSRVAWPGACAALLVTGALAIAPLAGELLRAPLPPRVAARALDLSPPVFVLECGGVDVERHPAVYESAGTVDIDPSLRSPWRGSLAAPIALVLGCALAWLAGRRNASGLRPARTP